VDIKRQTITLDTHDVIPYDILINTIPLDIFLSLTKDRSNSFLAIASQKLACNSVINFNVGITDRIISEKHWIYFPENQYPFYRLGFPHNFSDSMAPVGCSSLYGEFAYMKQSKKWVQDTTKEALAQAKKVLNLADNEIATTSIIPISHAYVTYDQWRERNLNQLLMRLSSENIHSIGRYGAWKYSSMQEAVLDGKTMAEAIVKESLTPVSTKHVYHTKENLHANTRHTQQQGTY
jgi:UDP-galactopyranose mutase